MNNNIEVSLEPKSKWRHISLILTGLSILSKKNKINLNLIDNSSSNNFIYTDNPGLEITIKDKKCYLDVADGYNNIEFMRESTNKYYMYFKRSYDQKINKKYGFHNVIPLGLNYEIYDKNIQYKYYCSSKVKKCLLTILKRSVFNPYYLKDYEYNGLYNVNNPKICFTVRLWDGKEFDELNNTRIELVRSLKKKYGDRFCGGIYDSLLARKLCPELIVNKLYTNKKRYLKRMHKCDICIATTGLHNSIGWKFAEYVMAGKVILSEGLKYYVPGNFEENKNYLVFNSVDECISIIDELISNKEQMIEISKNNINYYNEFLKPDKMMLYVINKVIQTSNK